MKKSVFFLLAMVFLFSTAVSAKEFTGDRWYWAYSNNEYSGYIDKNTLRYDPKTDKADAFVRWELVKKQVTAIYQTSYDFKAGTVVINKVTEYPYGSEMGNDWVNPAPKPFIPMPGSGEEQMISVIAKLVNREEQLEKLAVDRKAQEDKKQAEESRKAEAKKKADEKRKAEEEKARQEQKQKDNVSKGINILGSIFG